MDNPKLLEHKNHLIVVALAFLFVGAGLFYFDHHGASPFSAALTAPEVGKMGMGFGGVVFKGEVENFHEDSEYSLRVVRASGEVLEEISIDPGEDGEFEGAYLFHEPGLYIVRLQEKKDGERTGVSAPVEFRITE